MAKTPSTMLALGTQLPRFSLPATDGSKFTVAEQAPGKPWLVMFICNHCPFVIHVAQEISRIGVEYQERGVIVVAISANDVVNYPADSVANMILEKTNRDYTFPYLFDEQQNVAKEFRAACTPDFYVFDHDQRLAYRGQLDDSRPGNNIAVTGKDLRTALDAVLRKIAPDSAQRPSIGCNIKWKKGNEPEYF